MTTEEEKEKARNKIINSPYQLECRRIEKLMQYHATDCHSNLVQRIIRLEKDLLAWKYFAHLIREGVHQVDNEGRIQLDKPLTIDEIAGCIYSLQKVEVKDIFKEEDK
jgi:hypothetical protein